MFVGLQVNDLIAILGVQIDDAVNSRILRTCEEGEQAKQDKEDN